MDAAAYVTPGGELREARGHRPLAFHGRDLVPLDPAELIPLPPGSVISMLPDRQAVSAEGPLPGAPAAALLPIGYTRTLLPAYTRQGSGVGLAGLSARGGRQAGAGAEPKRLVGVGAGAAFLPLFGYAALAFRQGQPHVAAMPTDDPRPWQRPDPGYRELRRLIRRRLREAQPSVPPAMGPDRARPGTALLEHIAHCALVYECRSAQHLFYGQGEAALPSSPTCNAACGGCISDQPDPELQPHERLDFVPSIEESLEVAVRHLEDAPNAIISFGQGCEGEPLLNSRNARVIREIRKRTSRGMININTNGSRPQALSRLIEAGLGSIRVSVFSAREHVFRRYYRPVGYSLDQVRACLTMAAGRGLFTSVNLLTFPGITDDRDEVEALIELLSGSGVDLVQLRNLNIDPEQLLESFEGVEFTPIGIRAMAERFRRAGLAVGSYTHLKRAARV